MRPGRRSASGLRRLLRRRWLLAGVGNVLRGDDGFGPLLARRLRRLGLPALDAGPSPENVTGLVARIGPEVLLVADAVDLGEPPGAARLLRPDELRAGGTGTHDASLGLFLAYLAERTGGEPWILAVQPASLRLGAPLGPEVRATLEELTRLIRRGDRLARRPPPTSRAARRS